jgi:hypothetical protein
MWIGTVQNGVVILEVPGSIPDGTKVNVFPDPSSELKQDETKKEKTMSNTAKMLLKHAGVTDRLPEDMALNHDHYLHGQPKR